MRIALAALALLLVEHAVTPAWARPRSVDPPAGSLDITVVDTIALPHAGAHVVIEGPTLPSALVGVSNAEGRVHFGELAPGLYQVTASLDGFTAETWSDVRVPGAFQRSIRVMLAPGVPVDGTGVGARDAVLRELQYCQSDPGNKKASFHADFRDVICDGLESIGCTTAAGGTTYVLRAGNVIGIRSWSGGGADTQWGDPGAISAVAECLSRKP